MGSPPCSLYLSALDGSIEDYGGSNGYGELGFDSGE